MTFITPIKKYEYNFQSPAQRLTDQNSSNKNDLPEQNLRSLSARANALSTKTNRIPSWVKPVGLAALTVAGLAAIYFAGSAISSSTTPGPTPGRPPGSPPGTPPGTGRQETGGTGSTGTSKPTPTPKSPETTPTSTPKSSPSPTSSPTPSLSQMELNTPLAPDAKANIGVSVTTINTMLDATSENDINARIYKLGGGKVGSMNSFGFPSYNQTHFCLGEGDASTFPTLESFASPTPVPPSNSLLVPPQIASTTAFPISSETNPTPIPTQQMQRTKNVLGINLPESLRHNVTIAPCADEPAVPLTPTSTPLEPIMPSSSQTPTPTPIQKQESQPTKHVLGVILPKSLGQNVTIAPCAENEAAVPLTPTSTPLEPIMPSSSQTPTPTPIQKQESQPTKHVLGVILPKSLGQNVTIAPCAENEAAVALIPTPPSISPMAPTPDPTPQAKPSSTPLETTMPSSSQTPTPTSIQTQQMQRTKNVLGINLPESLGHNVTLESSFRDPNHVLQKERAMDGDPLEMDHIEGYWRQGTISSSDKEKSLIRNAFHSNLPKQARKGYVYARRELESLWKDGTLSATDEEKLSIRADSNSAIQQCFENELKVNAMSGDEFDMQVIETYWKEEFISSTEEEKASIRGALTTWREKKNSGSTS